MNVGFGKHGGMSVGTLVLKEPNYVDWLLQKENPSGQMVRVQAEVQRLTGIFDSKPIQTRKCGGCGKPATRCSVYRDNVHSLCWWCDSCDPYQTGATDGKLELVSTYQGALMYGQQFRLRKVDLEHLIKALAQAKGLLSGAGVAQVEFA